MLTPLLPCWAGGLFTAFCPCRGATISFLAGLTHPEGSCAGLTLTPCFCLLPIPPVLQAFLPSLSDACRRYPAALFVRLVLQSPVASAAAAAESQELMEGLQIGRLPCTLLLRGDQLLARLDVAADQPSAAAAAAAAVTLHEALAAALRPNVATDEQAAESEALNFSFAS